MDKSGTWLTLFVLSLILKSLAFEKSDQAASSVVDIKIGFLVASQRMKNGADQTSYSRPGRQLIYAFNFSIDKVNQLYSSSKSNDRINFIPVIGETYGNESESIKQTIELISKQRVNVIVGPQESCQVEPRLASVYDIAMVSYYCPQWTPMNGASHLLFPSTTAASAAAATATFIQTKPPHWKIVERVVTLVSQLLHDSNSVHNSWYPKQLVLLYFKESPHDNNNKRSSMGETPWNLRDATYQASDALQYKLIGELLEIRLNELLVALNDAIKGRQHEIELEYDRKSKGSLTVLNWSTIFHYGYTKNPFLRVIRRHQIQMRQQQKQEQEQDGSQCYLRNQATSTRPVSLLNDEKAAIYIVVGHYYEHLGLMLALDELNLLGKEQHQSKRSSVIINQQQSVVIGVDIEQYDERYDSVRFLRGLLMDYDQPKGDRRATTIDPDSIANMYRHYMGVVPARLTKMAEFLYEMRSVYMKNQQHQSNDDSSLREKLKSISNNNQTLDSAQLTTRLFQLIRLPVESFYLYDSVTLIGAYFKDCLQEKSTLECSEGRRMFEWFQNREYSSFVDDNQTRFDSSAQSEGSYTLISRRFINHESSSSDSLVADDEFGFVAPVGRFVVDSIGNETTSRIEFFVNSNELDQIWLPFWCKIKQQHSNISQCNFEHNVKVYPEYSKDSNELPIVGLVFVILLILFTFLSYYRFSYLKHYRHINEGWFSEEDERNFLTIVHKYLITPEILIQTKRVGSSFSGKKELHSLIELHCYMFPFPSCKFVHWLTALYQLKEMMFQYQSSVTTENNSIISTFITLIKSVLPTLKRREKCSKVSARGFFVNKHKSSASLRLLLNKYKLINRSFCALVELDHESLAKLYGTTLNYTGINGDHNNKLVRLVVEQPSRGNLRDAFKLLNENVSYVEAIEFRNIVTLTILNDLLNGLDYLHQSKIGFHGELRASTCMLTADWRLKLSGFHALHMRHSLGGYEQKNLSDLHMNDLIYSAPEVLEKYTRQSILSAATMRLADIYSFAFVVYELLINEEPWSCLTKVNNSKLIVERVKSDPSFRPPLEKLNNLNQEDTTLDLNVACRMIKSSWSHTPERRPNSIEHLRVILEHKNRKFSVVSLAKSTTGTLRSQLGVESKGIVMSCYAQLLESVSLCRGRALELECQRSLELRLRHLPETIATRLSAGDRGLTDIEQYECVSICVFRFILLPERESPLEQLNEILIQLDRLVDSYHKHIHLVDSQVDSSLRYLVYSGKPLALNGNQRKRCNQQHPQLIASFALQLIELANRCQSKFTDSVHVRCGIHCGPVLAGLILDSNFFHSSKQEQELTFDGLARYVLFGPTLHLADALESSSPAQRIQVSAEFRSQLLLQSQLKDTSNSLEPTSTQDSQSYVMIKREAKVYSKLVGDFEAYWLLNGPRLTSGQSLMLSAD